jgi:hypothetical protein
MANGSSDGTDKVVIDQAGGNAVQPFLPLDQIMRRPGQQPPAGAATTGAPRTQR